MLHRQYPHAAPHRRKRLGQNDAAALCVVTKPEAAERHGLTRLVELVSAVWPAVIPARWPGTVPAMAKALERAELTLDEMDLIELNEAFAAQTLGVLFTWAWKMTPTASTCTAPASRSATQSAPPARGS